MPGGLVLGHVPPFALGHSSVFPVQCNERTKHSNEKPGQCTGSRRRTITISLSTSMPTHFVLYSSATTTRAAGRPHNSTMFCIFQQLLACRVQIHDFDHCNDDVDGLCELEHRTKMVFQCDLYGCSKSLYVRFVGGSVGNHLVGSGLYIWGRQCGVEITSSCGLLPRVVLSRKE